VVLRDLEELSYEEIAEITQVSLGTVKSRVTRGRQALRLRLADYIKEVGNELGLSVSSEEPTLRKDSAKARSRISLGRDELEVAS
jgi:RNA polymerase sigma-70 factor (ECF subfamily)